MTATECICILNVYSYTENTIMKIAAVKQTLTSKTLTYLEINSVVGSLANR